LKPNYRSKDDGVHPINGEPGAFARRVVVAAVGPVGEFRELGFVILFIRIL